MMNHHITRFAETTTGVAASILIAVTLAFAASGTRWRTLVPWVFAAVLVLLCARFGAAVSILGSAGAAMVFAHSVYAPVGSLMVADPQARAALGWMALVAIVLSYLLFPPHIPRGTQKR